MSERKRIYLSVTEVQHARMFDAAKRAQSATLTEWLRTDAMTEVEKNEARHARMQRARK